MDKLSDYIPLAIILVSVVLSLLGKGKKNVVRHETMLPGKTPDESWFEEEEISPEPEKKVYKEVVPKRIVATTNTSSNFQKSHAKQIMEQQASVPEVEEEVSAPFLDTFDMDEIKKAIIYTEIFNRERE
jgi:hypothetical protein